VSAFNTKKEMDTVVEHEFALVCNEIKTKITTRLFAHAQLLRSGSSLFAASDNVTRNDWKLFNETAKINKNLPGILGVGFSLIIKKDQLQQHIQQIRNEGFSDYTVRPAGKRDVYTSIVYLEPFTDRNKRAFGYDMYSDSIRKKAMQLACDMDVAAMSGKVILVQETDKDLQAGTLMYVPVYKKGFPTNTINERRAAIIGWVYSPYRMVDLMHGILGTRDLNDIDKIHLCIYDNDDISQNSLLFDSQSNANINKADILYQTITLPIVFNNKKWTLEFSRPIEHLPFFKSKALIILISGLIITLLLFVLTFLLFYTKYKANEIAKRLTSDLKESEERFSLFMDQLPVSAFIKDKSGRNLYFNRQLIDLMGFNNWENKLNSELLIENEAIRVSDDDKKTLELGEYKYEETMKDRNGYTRTFETQKFIIRREGKEPFLGGISLDITERKKAEEDLMVAKENAEIKSANITAILGSTLDSIWAFDRDYNIVYINEVFREEFLKSFSVRLDLGISLIDSLPEVIRPIWKAKYDRVLFGKEQLTFEEAVDTNNGKIFIRTSMNPIINNGEVIGGSCFGSDITVRKLAEQELKESQEQLSNFASYLQNVREKERQLITLEIHDSLAQFLVALKMDMGFYLKKLLTENEAIKKDEVIYLMEQLINQVDKVIKTTRRIMNGLRPEQLELLGIIESIEVFLHDFEESHHIKCKFENALSCLELDSEKSVTLFRIFQETFNNILKHSNATLVTVKLTNSNGKLILEIMDNGNGFDQNQKVSQGSYGFIGMRERVKLLDGIFIISSKLNEGTHVTVEIPYEA
jgi:PAS domain S-box-containing protein